MKNKNEVENQRVDPSFEFILNALNELHVPEILQALRERKSIPKVPFIKRPLLIQLARLVESGNLSVHEIVSTGKKRQMARLNFKGAKRKRNAKIMARKGVNGMRMGKWGRRFQNLNNRAWPPMASPAEELDDPSWTPDMDSVWKRKKRKLAGSTPSPRKRVIHRLKATPSVSQDVPQKDDEIDWIREAPCIESAYARESSRHPSNSPICTIESDRSDSPFWNQLDDRLKVESHQQFVQHTIYKENKQLSIPQLQYAEEELRPGWAFRLNEMAKEQNYEKDIFNQNVPWRQLENVIQTSHWYCNESNMQRQFKVNPKQFERIQQRREFRTNLKRLKMLQLREFPEEGSTFY